MEKTTIFSQVPRPPKQIWEDDTAVETVNKAQVLPTENAEKPSAITILKPRDELVPSGADYINKSKNESGVEFLSNLSAFENKSLPSEDIEEPAIVVAVKNNDIDGLKNVIELKQSPVNEEKNNLVNGKDNYFEAENGSGPTADFKAATDVKIQDDSDLKDADEQDLAIHNEAETDIAFDENEVLGNKNDRGLITIVETSTDAEIHENKDFENRVAIINYTTTIDDKGGNNNYLKLEEDKELEHETDLELANIKIRNGVKDSTALLPKNTNLADLANVDVKMPNDEDLFKRQYYTMGEVATMFNANQSQIRFWENEFDILKPKKNKKGDRYFRPEDVKNLQLIHHLLRNKKFTIEGANEYLKNNKQRASDNISAVESLQQLKSFLIELKANL